jgi:hypothetical protein
MTRIGIITTEMPPFLPAPTAGGGVRMWGIGSGLVERGHEVIYFVPGSVLGNLSNDTTRAYLPESLEHQLSQAQIEVAIFEQWQPVAYLTGRLDIPTVIDLPGPLLLEYLWREPEAVNRHITDKIRCLSLADRFLIATHRQEYYYIPWLLLAGIDVTASRPLLCPFGLPVLPKCRQGMVFDEPRIFFGGVFWPWQDPSAYLRTVLERMTRVRRGQLVIIGGPHPYHAHPTPKRDFRDILEHPHTSFLGTLPFSDFVTELRRATVALDLAPPSPERELACPLRTGVALWSGTPVFIAPHSAWSGSVSQRNAGWIVPSSTDQAFIHTIDGLLRDSVDFKIKAEGARSLAQHELDAQENVAALDQYIRHPIRRPAAQTRLDRRTTERENVIRTLERDLAALKHKHDALESDLRAIRSKTLFRLYKRIQSFFE